MNKQAISVILIIVLSLSLTFTSSKVYAHNSLRIYEDNGQSNCGENWEYYFWEAMPSLIIEKIECNPDNKLSVIVVLQPAKKSAGPWQDIWEAEGEVYFDGEEIGVFDIRNPSYPEDGIDSYSYGMYTYLLPWEITTPVMVRVIIHTTATVEENDWKHYPNSYVFGQELVEPLANTSLEPIPNTSNRSVIYLPLLLGLIGLGLVLWIGYQSYGTRLFHRKLKS